MSGTVEICMKCFERLILRVVLAFAAVVTLMENQCIWSPGGSVKYSQCLFIFGKGELSSMTLARYPDEAHCIPEDETVRPQACEFNSGHLVTSISSCTIQRFLS